MKWYQSRTILASLVAVLASIFSCLRDAALQKDIVDWIASLVTLIAGAIAIWGRIKASRPISTKATESTEATENSQNYKLNCWWLLAAGCLLLAGGCVSQTYRAADVALFNAVAPEYAQYVSDDPFLTTEQKERRMRTIETWRLRVGE